jgi:hypothetical protein
VIPSEAVTVVLVLRRSAPALILSTLLLLPFLGKAFTIDDPVFLAEARHALTDPLHPSAFEMAWNLRSERVSAIVPTGPVMAWLLVPAVLSPCPEEVAHALQIGMLWIAILATVGLALRLGVPPAWASAAGLLLGVTPSVLGMAGTAMPDLPAMALGAAGLYHLLAWRQDRRWRHCAAAACLLGLAPLARTQLALLPGIGGLLLVGDVFSVSEWRRGPWTRWVPILGALLVTLGVTLATLDPTPGSSSVAAAAAGLSSMRKVIPNLLAFAIHWSLALPFAIPWFMVRWRPVLARIWVLIGSSAAAALLLRNVHPVSTPWVLAPVAGLTVTALWDVLLDAFRRRDSTQLTLGIWLLLALPAAIYVHLPSKFLLASAPAAAILVARAMATSPRLGRITLLLASVASAALGVAILRADTAFADLGRTAARTLIAPEVARGHRVWYVGHWGFQGYAEQAGARFFPIEPPYPQEGDLVVACLNCEPHLYVDQMEALVPLRRLRYPEPGGRTMDKSSNAGFFSNTWGYLPWAWSGGVLEGFDVFQVVYPK